jgi:hypothetical protein
MTRAYRSPGQGCVASVLGGPVFDRSILLVLEPERALSTEAGDSTPDAEEPREARGDRERGDDKHDNFKRGDHHLTFL